MQYKQINFDIIQNSITKRKKLIVIFIIYYNKIKKDKKIFKNQDKKCFFQSFPYFANFFILRILLRFKYCTTIFSIRITNRTKTFSNGSIWTISIILNLNGKRVSKIDTSFLFRTIIIESYNIVRSK